MSLNGALQIGQSAILASQAAIGVAGNNMANAATPGYHRQRIGIMPGRSEAIGRGQFVGTGVQLGSITRQIDVALQARLRSAIGEQAGAAIEQRFLSALELLQNDLTDPQHSSSTAGRNCPTTRPIPACDHSCCSRVRASRAASASCGRSTRSYARRSIEGSVPPWNGPMACSRRSRS